MTADTFSFTEFKHRDVIALTEELARLAKTGQIKSLLAVIDLGNNKHEWVIAGDYRKAPGTLFRPCNKLFFKINELDEQQGDC